MYRDDAVLYRLSEFFGGLSSSCDSGTRAPLARLQPSSVATLFGCDHEPFTN
jgi:hypothetical protein